MNKLLLALDLAKEQNLLITVNPGLYALTKVLENVILFGAISMQV